MYSLIWTVFSGEQCGPCSSCYLVISVIPSRLFVFSMLICRVKMKNTDKDVTQLLQSTTNFTEGEELKIEWQVEKQPITFHGKMEFPLKVWRNGTLVSMINTALQKQSVTIADYVTARCWKVKSQLQLEPRASDKPCQWYNCWAIETWYIDWLSHTWMSRDNYIIGRL